MYVSETKYVCVCVATHRAQQRVRLREKKERRKPRATATVSPRPEPSAGAPSALPYHPHLALVGSAFTGSHSQYVGSSEANVPHPERNPNFPDSGFRFSQLMYQ